MACFRSVDDPRAGGWAMRHLSSLAYRRGDMEQAAAWTRDGLSFVEQTANRLYVARLLLNVSLLSVLQLDLERAETLSPKALHLLREEGDRWGEADAFIRLGRVAHERGDLASTHLDASLSLLRDIGDPEGMAVVLTLFGWVRRSQGAQSVAASHFAEGLTLSRERHHPCGASGALLGEGALAMDRNDRLAAAAAWDESLELVAQSEDPLAIATVIEWIAHLTASGNHEAGVRLSGAASMFREAQGIPEAASTRDERARLMARMQSVLGPTAFAEAFGAGRSMSEGVAIAEAKGILAQARSGSHGLSPEPVPALLPMGTDAEASTSKGLTQHEREVLQLLTEGRSNREIAQTLFIRPRTAAVHIDHILTKLGLGSRVAAAAFAVRHGLA
jgi:DNA-binding CsgD family transcriptional regulator